MHATFRLDPHHVLHVGYKSESPVTGRAVPIKVVTVPPDGPPYNAHFSIHDGPTPEVRSFNGDPTVVFYGPHPCEECGVTIVKASREQGGQAYDIPFLNYPNARWFEHVHETGYIPSSQTILNVALKPSHARAVASAILAAATEAKAT